MPIINIKCLPAKKRLDVPKILTKLCTEGARTTGQKPEHMWAVWEFIEPKNFAVGKKLGRSLSKTTHSPIVRILSFEGRSQTDINKMMTKIAEILSKELKIDIGNIFIEYSEAHSGMIFDGGNVVFSKSKRLKNRK